MHTIGVLLFFGYAIGTVGSVFAFITVPVTSNIMALLFFVQSEQRN